MVTLSEIAVLLFPKDFAQKYPFEPAVGVAHQVHSFLCGYYALDSLYLLLGDNQVLASAITMVGLGALTPRPNV